MRYLLIASPVDAMRAAMRMLDVEDPMTVAHTLKGAIEQIDTRGWAQRVIVTPEGKVCAVGSVAVTRYSAEELPLMSNVGLMGDAVVAAGVIALATTLGWTPPDCDPPATGFLTDPRAGVTAEEVMRVSAFLAVAQWNDVALLKTNETGRTIIPKRSVAEVKDLFRQTIAILEVL
jgi:uncharacterized protein (AIM24 family)